MPCLNLSDALNSSDDIDIFDGRNESECLKQACSSNLRLLFFIEAGNESLVMSTWTLWQGVVYIATNYPQSSAHIHWGFNFHNPTFALTVNQAY